MSRRPGVPANAKSDIGPIASTSSPSRNPEDSHTPSPLLDSSTGAGADTPRANYGQEDTNNDGSPGAEKHDANEVGIPSGRAESQEPAASDQSTDDDQEDDEEEEEDGDKTLLNPKPSNCLDSLEDVANLIRSGEGQYLCCLA